MNSNSKLKSVWNKHAIKVNYKIPTINQLKESNDFIINYLFKVQNKNHIKLLDAGCGVGQYVTAARILGFNAQGIDISEAAVNIARKRGENVVLGDIRKLPYGNGSFDIIISGGVIEHFPETDKAIKEISRVLKPNGIFIGNVPYKYALVFNLSKKIQDFFHIWKAGYEKSFSLRKFKNLLESNGFRADCIQVTKIAKGKHKLLGKIMRMLDFPFFCIGLGGAHFYFIFSKLKNQR